MDLITLLVLVIVIVLVLWILEKYVVSLLPEPLGRIIIVTFALAMVLFLLARAGILNF